MWSDWLVVCDCGFSLSALWSPLSVPTILLGFLLPWAWGISSRLLQQSTATAPYLGWGVSPYCHRSWPSTWDSSSRPSCEILVWGPIGSWVVGWGQGISKDSWISKGSLPGTLQNGVFLLTKWSSLDSSGSSPQHFIQYLKWFLVQTTCSGSALFLVISTLFVFS